MRSMLIVASLLALTGCAGSELWHCERAELLQLDESRPVVIVDIDDTVVAGGTWNSVRIFLNLAASRMEPFPDAPQVVRALQRDHDVVFVTARDDSLARRTLRWLERHGFPRTPVFFSTSYLPGTARKIEYKGAVVAEVQRRGFDVRHGFGDKASDIAAYTKHGVSATLILDGAGDEDLDLTLELLGVEAWPVESGHATLLKSLIFSTDEAWRRIGEDDETP